MEIKSFELTNAEGKRNTILANGLRKQMIEKTVSVLTDAGLEAVIAANGDIAIATCVDATTGDTYYFRLAPSLSAKDLDSKVAKKTATKKEPVEIPSLF